MTPQPKITIRNARAARALAWHDESNPFSRHRLEARTESFDDIRRHNDYLEERFELPASLGPSPPPSIQETGTHLAEHDRIEPVASDVRPPAAVPVLQGLPGVAKPEVLKPEYKHPQVKASFVKWKRRWPRPTQSTVEKPGTDESQLEHSKVQRQTLVQQTRRVVFATQTNILFLLVPVGFVLYYTKQHPAAIFTVNAVAIIPSASMLSFGVDEIGSKLGEIRWGLLSASLGNAAQLISSILLLTQRQLGILRSSLLGVILANLLFMTGLSFVAGGIFHHEQYFNRTLAQTVCCLLMLAVLSLIIPSAAHRLVDMTEVEVLKQSRGIAVVIILSYLLWLFFQLKTHNQEFRGGAKKVGMPVDYGKYKGMIRSMKKKLLRASTSSRTEKKAQVSIRIGETNSTSSARISTEQRGRTIPTDAQSNFAVDELVEPELKILTAVIVVAISLTLLWFATEFAINSLQGLCTTIGLSETFVGVAIVPLISNDWFLLRVAKKDKMDLVISSIFERCMQTALLLIPLIVLIGWWINVEMTLEFNSFVIASTFASMVMVSYIVQEGTSNWLVGSLLIKAYVIICIATFFITNP